jgi:hypothetical protein
MKQELLKSIVFQTLYQQHKASKEVLLLNDYSVYSSEDHQKGDFQVTPLGFISSCEKNQGALNVATLKLPDGTKLLYTIQTPKSAVDFKKSTVAKDNAISLFHVLMNKASTTEKTDVNLKMQYITVHVDDMQVVIPSFVNTKIIKKHSLLQYLSSEDPASKKPRHG